MTPAFTRNPYKDQIAPATPADVVPPTPQAQTPNVGGTPSLGSAPLGAWPTPGPWQYVPSTEHHGPYVTSEFGCTICDFYTMTLPNERSTANGGPSRPIHFMYEMADANALVASLAPEMADELRDLKRWLGPDLFTSTDVYQARCATSMKRISALLSKLKGSN